MQKSYWNSYICIAITGIVIIGIVLIGITIQRPYRNEGEMRKKVINGISVLACALLVTGCGNAIPELDDQQRDLVVGYASEVLLKHSNNYDYKLLSLSAVEEMEEALGEEAVDSEEQDGESAPSAEESKQEVEVRDNAEESVSEITSIEDFLGLDSVKITYTGCEISDVYPEQGEELYFIMNATEGTNLLVLKFLTENTSGSEVNLDIAGSQIRFKITVDGETKNALTTLLLNDLAYFKGTLGAGESTELVLVCEIPENVEEISSLELTMKNVDERATISLN